jgi:uncharacterized phage protein (TIGR01671 family)
MIPKYRAWDKRFSEFVEDFFVSEDGKIYQKTKDTGYGFAISRETSDKVILMQSTGLKDKNGKEIFEGDVVYDGFRKIIVNYGKQTKEEEFGGISEYVGFNLTLACGYPEAVPINYEIIGNIYENPELLK